jgi:dolichol-phosphate mannosyltransferase
MESHEACAAPEPPPRPAGLLSVVCPAHDEAGSLEELHRRLADVLGSRGIEFEWVVVDDGSSDDTFDVIRRIARADPRVRGLRLSRSFGHQAALLAGLREARGAAVVMMDSDLQHPPECVPALWEAWRAGHEVVTTTRRDADHVGLAKRLTSRAFYAILRFTTRLDIGPGSADFCLLDRRALDAVLALGEQRVFLRGAVRWIGFRQARIEYDPSPRFAGRSSYSLFRMVRLAADGIFAFSAAPTRMLFALCALFTSAAVVYGGYVLVSVFRGGLVAGWASVILVLLGLGAVLSLGMGILGEYIWRIYCEVRRRPTSIVAERLGPGGDPPRPGA